MTQIELASTILKKCRERGILLVTAESATGGMIASRLTDVAGASECYWGGIVAYQEKAKEALLEVERSLIDRHGVVSKEVAHAMATGAVATVLQGLDPSQGRAPRIIAVSTTGVAGPGGGTEQTPIGTCFIGFASSGGKSEGMALRPGKIALKTDRQSGREQFTQAALEGLLRVISLWYPS